MDFEQIMADLKQKRDELKLQLHLASKDAEDEWEELVGEWDKFMTRNELDKSSEEVGEAAKQLGLKVKEAYDRMRAAKD